MSNLVRRRPATGLIDSFFDDAFFAPLSRARGGSATWIPPVDLSQTEDHFVLRADLPGLTRDDIELTVEDRTLTLTGSRTFTGAADGEEAQESYSRIERSFGSFTRTFQLPSNVDTSKIEASFADGVLTLQIAKLEQAKSRRIEIG